MTIKEICDTVFRFYLYADAVKMIHYSTESNHAHELCDKVRDAIVNFADELAEQSFGFYGKPNYSDFSKLSELDINDTDDLGKICNTVKLMTDSIRSDYEKNGKLSGAVSLIDDFKGEMDKLMFLCTFDKVSNYKGNNE